MTLIIIIAAILIERFWPDFKNHCQKNYFSLAVNALLDLIPEKIKDNQLLFLIVLLVVPFVVVYLLHIVLLNVLGGLLALVFDIVILLLCVNTRCDDDRVETFIAAQLDNDTKKHSDAFFDLTGEYIETIDHPNSFITRFILLQSIRRWFGVIFYFLLLGPAGVILYRSLQDFVKHEKIQVLHDKLQLLFDYIEWPLSRLLALTFFLSGSFDDALKGWKNQSSYSDNGDRLVLGNAVAKSNQVAILSTGCAAISHDTEDNNHNDTAYVQAAQGMLMRSLIIWCAVIALMTLTNVFV